MSFTRGTVVYHKVMGKGIVINQVEKKGEKMFEVRMENGHPQVFYPEELDSEETILQQRKAIADQVQKANEERAKRWGL